MSQTDPIAEFNNRLRVKMDGGMERRKAMLAVCKADPDLHEEWLEALNAASANDKAKKESKARKFGGDPLGEGEGEGEGGDDPVAEFDSRIRKRVADGMTRRRAVIAVANADKELHHRYLKATNADRSKVQSLIDQRAEM